MNRDDSAEIVFLTGTLAVAAERSLGGLPDGVVLQKAHKSDGRCKSLELSGKGERLAEEAIR